MISYGMDVYYIGPGGLTHLRTTADLSAVHTLGYWNFLLTSRPVDEIGPLDARRYSATDVTRPSARRSTTQVSKPDCPAP